MRTIVLTGLLAIALLGAVLGAIGVHSSTWVSAGEADKQAREPADRNVPILVPRSKGA